MEAILRVKGNSVAAKRQPSRQLQPSSAMLLNVRERLAMDNSPKGLTSEPIAKLPTLSFPRRFWAGIQFLTI